MNPKQLIFLSVVTVVAIAAALLLGGKDKRAEPEGLLAAGDQVLADLPVNDIARIEIREGVRSTTLERKDGGWGVAEREGYPADFSKIKRVVTALRDLKVSESIVAGESVLGRFQLKAPAEKDEDAGRLVRLSGEDGKEVAGLVIGKSFAGAVTDTAGGMKQGAGNYVRSLSKDGQVFIVPGSFNDIQAGPSNWLERRPIAIRNPKTVEVVQPEGATFRFTRESEGGEVTMEGLAEDEEMNTANTMTLSSPFPSLSFSDVMIGDDAKPQATGLDDPVTIRVSTFDGFSYTLKLGRTEKQAAPGDTAEPEGAEPAPPTTEIKYFVSYDVEAKLADTRLPKDDEKVAEDASEEDKKKAERLKKTRDEEFAKSREALEEKLAKEKALAGKVYEIDSFEAQKFFMGRDALVKDKAPDAEGGTSPAPRIPEATIPGLPGSTIPGVVPTGPVTPEKPAGSAAGDEEDAPPAGGVEAEVNSETAGAEGEPAGDGRAAEAAATGTGTAPEGDNSEE